jgi:hypothetical protein
MALTPKAKAFTFAASLLLVSSIMVGTSIATTGSVLRPFAAGEGYAEERSLTRGHHVALGVVVREIVDGEPQPVAGAAVSVARPGQDVIANKTTDSEGVAVFELRPGAYDVLVTYGDLNATQKVAVGQSMRVAVVFDGSGESRWAEKDHKQMERRGETAPLAVRVMRNETDGPVPVEGAIVKVYSLGDDGARELVEEATTGARGFVNFELHRGRYVVNITAGDVSAEKETQVRGASAIGMLIDGDEVQWRTGRMPEGQDHGKGPPSDRPSPSRPPHGGSK